MMRSYREAVRRARVSYSEDKRESERRTDLPSYLLYRPLSFWITPLFVWAGCSANAATLLGLALAALMPLAARLNGALGAYAVVALALAFQLLDCVDGNLARMRGTESRVGEMLDSITSLLFWSLYFLAIGVAAEGSSGHFFGQNGLEVGLALSALLLAQRELEDTFESYCGERVRWEPPARALGARLDLARFGRVLEQALAFLGLALAARLSALDLFLAGVALWQGTLLALWLVRFAQRVGGYERRAANHSQYGAEET